MRTYPPPAAEAEPRAARRPRRRLAARLALASIVAVAGLVVGYIVMVRTSLGQSFENAGSIGALGSSPGVVATDRGALERITGDSLAVVLVALVAIGVARRRFLLGLGVAFSAGLSVVLADVLKLHLLTRPELVPLRYLVGDPANTYPSGHTATAVGCAMALIVVSPARWRGVAAVVAGGYGWLTAVQVQTAGWHRPSDAVGAGLLAFAVITAVAAVLAWVRPARLHSGPSHRGALLVLASVAALSALGSIWGLVKVLPYLHRHPWADVTTSGVGHTAYLTGLALTVTVIAGLLSVLLALLGRTDLDASPA